MTEVTYGISVTNEHGDHLYDDNSRALFETMSGIKSVIGTLAIGKAARGRHDIDDYSVSVAPDHQSNGSGHLKHRLAAGEPFTPTLRELLTLNIAQSDCVATNVLIDYLGGKQDINADIQHKLGLRGIFLVTDRIRFTGVDHDRRPFQVGAATVRDMSEYYRRLWSDANGLRLGSSAHTWHRHIHGLGRYARLLGRTQDDLPTDVSWLHKTGSGDDVRPGYLYSTVMDAGELTMNGRTLYIAAASTTRHDGEGMPQRTDVENDFALSNMKALANL